MRRYAVKIIKGPNLVEQKPPARNARPNGYYTSRKRRIKRGLLVGKKASRIK